MSMKAYIVGGYRSAIGKAPKGSLRFTRPDDIGAVIIRHLLNDFPQIETAEVDDVIVGNRNNLRSNVGSLKNI